MSEFVLALLVALTGWWFSTGVILWLVHRPGGWHPAVFAATTVCMVGAFAGINSLAADTSSSGVVISFCLTLVLWGWLEMGYLMGFVTGPRKQACPEGAPTGERIRLGLKTCIWHELVLLVMVAALFGISWQQPNQVALWTFSVLWLMRWSSKMNLVLGVRNYNHSWLPTHLSYVDSYIPRRPFNGLFPMSLLAGAAVSYALLQSAAQTDELGVMIALTLAGGLAVLGTLEHVFLMLPLGDASLWVWAAPDGTKPVSEPGSSGR